MMVTTRIFVTLAFFATIGATSCRRSDHNQAAEVSYARLKDLASVLVAVCNKGDLIDHTSSLHDLLKAALSYRFILESDFVRSTYEVDGGGQAFVLIVHESSNSCSITVKSVTLQYHQKSFYKFPIGFTIVSTKEGTVSLCWID